MVPDAIDHHPRVNGLPALAIDRKFQSSASLETNESRDAEDSRYVATRFRPAHAVAADEDRLLKTAAGLGQSRSNARSANSLPLPVLVC